jgi:hypothetical protein
MSTAALKGLGWGTWLWFMACMVVAILSIVWIATTTPDVTDDNSIAIVAVCRDGTAVVRRPDGSHYIRKGFHRYNVPNPETVCR